MNLFLYIFCLLIGFIGYLVESRNGKTSIIHKIIFLATFVLCCISRVGHSYPYSDLTHYIDFFKEGHSAYFEPGYVWFTDLLRNYWGTSGSYLVAGISIWITFWSIITVCVLQKNYEYHCKNTLVITHKHNIRKREVFFAFFLLFITYWGMAFATEGLRTGMAVSMLITSAALIINGRKLYSFIVALVALLFHSSCILFFPLLLIILCQKHSKKQVFFTKWLVLLILFDILAQSFSFLNMQSLFAYLSGIDIDAASHFTSYEDSEMGSYFDSQYITYHLLALLFLKGDFTDSRYAKSVFIYYFGLTMGSIFQTVAVFMRIQWLFLVMNVIAIAYVLYNPIIKRTTKDIIVLIYVVLQAIMILRYLGYSY